MAEVLTIGPFLPLLALGGGAAMLIQRGRVGAPPEHEPSEEERRRMTQMLDLEHNGANASVFQHLHNKSFLMGGDMKEVLDLHHPFGGYDPVADRDNDLLGHMFEQHAEVSEFDRQDTYYSITTGQGEVRMRRHMPIAATLSEELHHPNDVTRKTSFNAYRHHVDWANEAQIQAVKRQNPKEHAPGPAIRKYWDSEFFNRAPGQSFRYE